MIRGDSYGKLPAIFGECYSKPMIDDNNHQNYHAASAEGCGSMMRRIRLRESIQSGMTSCRRDKLGLGLSLLYHLVGAQGSDLRYEIVSESLPPSASPGVHVPSMTKFWFLLPMSLDFPDRLPAEQIVKDNLNQVHPQHSPQRQPNNRQQQQPSSLSSAVPLPAARSSLLPSTFSMAPTTLADWATCNSSSSNNNKSPGEREQGRHRSHRWRRWIRRTASSAPTSSEQPWAVMSPSTVIPNRPPSPLLHPPLRPLSTRYPSRRNLPPRNRRLPRGNIQGSCPERVPSCSLWRTRMSAPAFCACT